MTATEHAEIIISNLAEYMVGMDKPYEVRDVFPILDSVTNAFAKRGMLEGMKLGDQNVPDQYAIEFKNLPIYYDKDYNLCYTPLPATPIALPFGRGVDFVSGMRNRQKQFYVVNRNQLSNSFGGWDANEGNTYCWKEGKRLYYSTQFDETNAPKVFVRLIVASASQIDRDAEYPIDPASEYEVRNAVIQYFMGIDDREQDLTKDRANTNLPQQKAKKTSTVA